MIQTIVTVLVAIFLVNLLKTVFRIRGLMRGIKPGGGTSGSAKTHQRFEAGTATVEDADFVEIKPRGSGKEG